ncbi:MAG: hypothetical protein AB1742_07080 [bacterium]
MESPLGAAAIAVSALVAAGSVPARALDVKEKSLEGTENAAGLTDKQLAIQRWFAELTFLNEGGDGWEGWYVHENQLGLESIRYSLAFLGYAAAAMAYKTPAYREATARILDDSVRRMVEKRVWDFIEVYWKDDPHFPDPVAWENIMYSGHLAQLIALYESITGDMKYSTEGWDFVWDEETAIHYTAEKLMKAMYDQVALEPIGGISCEPDMVFIICNDHPHNAFALYDAIHGTKFTALDEKWRAWMEENGRLPKEKGKEYLKITYMRDRGVWATGFGTPGSDGWALAWMYPWTSNPRFVCEGWETMRDSRLWRVADGGGIYYRSTTVAQMAGIKDTSGTSFYPLVESQCLRSGEGKAREVFQYFENLAGTFADWDGDGMRESYYYDTEPDTRLWVTANLAAAMVTEGDSLREMYREPFFRLHEGEPYVASVAYPDVTVKKAEFFRDSDTLRFTVLRAGGEPGGETEIVCGNVRGVKALTRNGAPYGNYAAGGGAVRIKTPVSGEVEFEMVVK